MKDLISVIVPVYNVEDYLKKCLDSIINQTYSNLEIILIDDGSQDHCPQICDDYVKQDKRVKVVHQENGGLSNARNCGLNLAKGKYIAFVDSDDTIHQQMYERLYKNLKKFDADISICNYRIFYGEDSDLNISGMEESIKVFRGKKVLENIYGSLAGTTVVAWNKLYKKELFDNIRYEDKKIHEDEFIIHKILDKANTVVYSNLPLYNYLQRDSSIMGQKFHLGRLDALEALEDRIDFFWKKGYIDLYAKSIDCYLKLILAYYYAAKQNLNDDYSAFLRDKFKEYYGKVDCNVELSKETKIKCKLFLLSPLIYHFLWKLSKINSKK